MDGRQHIVDRLELQGIHHLRHCLLVLGKQHIKALEARLQLLDCADQLCTRTRDLQLRVSDQIPPL